MQNIIGFSEVYSFDANTRFHYDRDRTRLGSTTRIGSRAVHYDGDHQCTGFSEIVPGGIVLHYDAENRLIGKSVTGMLPRTDHYDLQNRRLGHSENGVIGSIIHYADDPSCTMQTLLPFL